MAFNIVLFIPTNSITSQSNFKELVEGYFNKRDQFESLTAEVEFLNKVYASDDTMRTIAFIEVISIPTDTFFNGYMMIQTDTEAYAYDGVNEYLGDTPSSTLGVNEIVKNPNWLFIYDWTRNFIETSFLTKDQKGRAALLNPDFYPIVSDTVIRQWPCKGVYLSMPDQGEFTQLKIFVAIDTIDYMLRHRSVSMVYQENEQYQSWTYTNPVYGHEKKLTRLNEDFLASYKYQELLKYISPDDDDAAIEQIDYSGLNGKRMGNGEAFNIKNSNARLIIMDFWYSACYPCIKSIPEVNKLYDLFHDKGVAIYGVNIIDDEIANKSRMEKYVRNNPMSYPTIMADRELYSHWVPDGYPSLIILDSNFKLITRHTGFSEDMADKLGHIIEEYLNK